MCHRNVHSMPFIYWRSHPRGDVRLCTGIPLVFHACFPWLGVASPTRFWKFFDSLSFSSSILWGRWAYTFLFKCPHWKMVTCWQVLGTLEAKYCHHSCRWWCGYGKCSHTAAINTLAVWAIAPSCWNQLASLTWGNLVASWSQKKLRSCWHSEDRFLKSPVSLPHPVQV